MSDKDLPKFLKENRQTIFSVLEIVLAILFLISLVGLYHYEWNIKGHYEKNSESYQSDAHKITSYLDRKGCASVGEVAEKMDFGYLQARYVMHKMSKNGLLVKYADKKICLTLLGEAQTTPAKTQ